MPLCLGVQGIENDDTLLKQADLVFKDELVSVFVNSFWMETVEGHVIVVPNAHYENIYDMQKEVGQRIFETVQTMALVLKKAYGCDGITTRQNNGPAGNQHALHYHHHVYPRYEGDQFNENMSQKSVLSQPEQRVIYVDKLKRSLVELA